MASPAGAKSKREGGSFVQFHNKYLDSLHLGESAACAPACPRPRTNSPANTVGLRSPY